MRTVAKRDSNEPEIRSALEAVGVRVHPISQAGVPDLLCGVNGRLFMVEVKVPGENLTAAQKTFHAAWAGFPIHVAFSVEQAIQVAAHYVWKMG